MNKLIRIISRKSKLALWQANYVKQQLQSLYPELQIIVTGISTHGDRLVNMNFNNATINNSNSANNADGGIKGLFTKELELALINQQADLAVHSLKDVPMVLDERFILAALLKRANPNDVFVSDKYASLDLVPDGGLIGTSSARRKAQLEKYYPRLQVALLRGNVDTRLEKLAQGNYAGVIIASAGVERLGLQDKISQQLNPERFIPAIGQGTLAVETLANNYELIQLLVPLMDADTAKVSNVEREVGRLLNAGCSLPLAAYAKIDSNIVHLHAMLLDEFNQYRTAVVAGYTDDSLSLAQQCVDMLCLFNRRLRRYARNDS